MAFSFFNSSKDEQKHESSFWNHLTSTTQLEEVLVTPKEGYQLIFKHSTRCIISRTVLKNFEADWKRDTEGVELFLLDLLSHRDVSGAIAEHTGVEHQSPQLLLVKDGKVLMHRSHNGIEAEEVLAQVQKG